MKGTKLDMDSVYHLIDNSEYTKDEVFEMPKAEFEAAYKTLNK